jgi:uroporphyrinogen III methyltransferase/synthase
MSKVYLVGAGPGDPDLITVKGRAVLEQADVVMYDHLASDDLLAFAPASAERVYVGKKKSAHSHSQEDISQLLIDYARQGKTVVRLKGGDPFIFGRGGEEMEALVDAGISYEVVPGVTAALGIAAYSGVPLTHRDHTSSVTFVTGHDPAAIDWSKVGLSETLVIYMGLSHASEICERLITSGRRSTTPAMAVRWGTRAEQSTVTGTLADLGQRIEDAALKPPATIFIGDVVGLRDKLNWFEKLPLFGKKIVVTRAHDQASGFSHQLHALGATVIEYPVIEIAAPEDTSGIDAAIARLSEFDWLIFTSANGVRYFLERLDASPADLRSLRAKLCAIGPVTKAALEAIHLKVDVLPEEYVAESLVKAFEGISLEGKRILLPRAAVARDVVPIELAKRGAIVEVVEAYRTRQPQAAKKLGGDADWLTFTSSSTVKNFIAMAGLEPFANARLASIGPVTSETLRANGLTVHVEAQPHTMDGLLEAILSAVTCSQ